MLLAILIAGLVLVLLFFWTRFLPTRATAFLLALSRRVAGMKRREIHVAGFRIVYLEGGRGEPLLLLHGVGADKDNFNFVAGTLRRHYRVIVPDLPGFGDSDKPDAASYRAPDQVARMIAFADAVGAERFHLAGNSMGGLIAGAIAAAHPGRVLSLWLLAPAGVKSAQPSELMQKLEAGEPLPIFARDAREMRAVLAFVSHRPPYLPGFVIEAMALRQRETFALNQRVVAQLVEGPWLEEIFEHRPAVPTLIVWGERDRALDSSGAAILHGLLPNSQLVLMPDIGHVPMIEAPGTAVRDFLRFQAGMNAASLAQGAARP